MASISLRTLTMKSKIGFGKYSDFTVERMLINDKSWLLVYYYYAYSNINFVDEVLDNINIKSEKKIEKPGKFDNDKALDEVYAIYPHKEKVIKTQHITRLELY